MLNCLQIQNFSVGNNFSDIYICSLKEVWGLHSQLASCLHLMFSGNLSSHLYCILIKYLDLTFSLQNTNLPQKFRAWFSIAPIKTASFHLPYHSSEAASSTSWLFNHFPLYQFQILLRHSPELWQIPFKTSMNSKRLIPSCCIQLLTALWYYLGILHSKIIAIWYHLSLGLYCWSLFLLPCQRTSIQPEVWGHFSSGLWSSPALDIKWGL